MKLIKSAYDEITGIPGKIKDFANDMQAALNTYVLALGQSKRARYSYVSARVSNLQSPVYDIPGVGDIMDSYTDLAVTENNIFPD